jgi:hypothetical protein
MTDEHTPRLVQIAVSECDDHERIAGLDEKGHVWLYNFTDSRWKPLNMVFEHPEGSDGSA